MLTREILGFTVAGLVAAALAFVPGTDPASAPGPAAGQALPVAPAAASGVAVHPCPETSESACRAVFLPPLASNDDDGAAHTSHQPQVQICGPLDEGVSWQSVSSCDDPGTGEQVEHFPFQCGDMSECVEVTGDQYQANWRTNAGGDDDDDEGDEDDDEDEEDEDEDDEGGGKGKGKGGDDDDDDGDGGDGLENGYYLINVRLNGNSAGGIVVELGQGGGGGTPPRFNNGSTIPIKFRLHDKIVG